MFSSFNKYKYHHRILQFLFEKEKERYSKDEHVKSEFKSSEIAEKFKISENFAIEILTDLRTDKLVSFSKYGEMYIIADAGYRYVKRNHFKYLSSKHNTDFIFRYIKDGLLIVLSFIGVISFFINLNIYDKLLEQNNKQLELLELEQKSIRTELDAVKKSQLKNLLKTQDSF